jgi:hypothetical protein
MSWRPSFSKHLMLQPYLLNKLLPKLKSKVFMPQLNNANIPILWTNNNNEAYNNVIKQNQNWAVLKLPALTDKLQERRRS